jgi:hypothetical protein
MVLGRLISLLLSTALVACPTVCQSGNCAQCPVEATKTAACPHCPASDDSHDERSPVRAPAEPRNHCEHGNCLCSGAVTGDGGLALQIGHVLGVFAAYEALSEQAYPADFSTIESAVALDHHDPQASGRRLRLRIESLLI